MIPNTLTRAAVFIDGANNSQVCKSLRMQLDWSVVRNDMFNQFNAIRLYYYTALLTNEAGTIDIMPLVDWLEFNGYTVVTKAAKTHIRDDGTTRVKGDMDMEIAVDAIRLAPRIDHVILFSGDGDFCYLVHALKQLGVYVTVVSSKHTNILSSDLERSADNFIDLHDKQAWYKNNDIKDKALPLEKVFTKV